MGTYEETTERRARWPRVLLGALLALLLVAGFLLVRGVMGPEVEGRVLWHERGTVEQLGPDGWFVAHESTPWWRFRDEDRTVLHNVLTGQETDLGEDPRVDYLLPDGGVLSASAGVTIRDSSGAERVAIEEDAIGAGIESLAGLEPGEVAVVGASEQTVALIGCYSAERELLSSEEPGSHAVMAGFSLADGERVWARDTGRLCDASSIFHRPVPALGALEHVMVFDGGTAQALRIDDGEVAASWEDTRSNAVVLQDGLALHPVAADTLQVTDLGTGDVLAEASCPGARVMNPGTTANLSPEASLAIDCGGESAQLYDREAREFVSVDVPTGGEDRLIPDGAEVLYDRYVLSRDGTTVRVVDALEGDLVAEFTAPTQMEIQTNAPRGRVLLLYRVTNFDEMEYEAQAVDLRTGEMLVTSSRKIAPGILVDPSGAVALNHSEYVRTSSQYGDRETEERLESWIVGTEGEPLDG